MATEVERACAWAGKVAVVTGAGSGIGRAIALEFGARRALRCWPPTSTSRPPSRPRPRSATTADSGAGVRAGSCRTRSDASLARTSARWSPPPFRRLLDASTSWSTTRPYSCSARTAACHEVDEAARDRPWPSTCAARSCVPSSSCRGRCAPAVARSSTSPRRRRSAAGAGIHGVRQSKGGISTLTRFIAARLWRRRHPVQRDRAGSHRHAPDASLLADATTRRAWRRSARWAPGLAGRRRPPGRLPRLRRIGLCDRSALLRRRRAA